MGLCCIIISQLFNLQVLSKKYSTLAEEQGKFRKVIYPDRGILYDRKGKAILLSVEVLSLPQRETRDRVPRGDVFHWRQRHPRRSATRPQNDRSAAVNFNHGASDPAPLQCHRWTFRGCQRRAADPGPHR